MTISFRFYRGKAPQIIQRGDTLSYRLSSFAGKGDYTLRDAMKRLPGIEVTSSGSIKYLGKDISNFYIEGMDLLGGQYNVATNNIPADYVTSVQVLNLIAKTLQVDVATLVCHDEIDYQRVRMYKIKQRVMGYEMNQLH